MQLSNILQGKCLINRIHDSFTNKSAVNSIILIQDRKSPIEIVQLAEEDVNTLWFSVIIDDSINKRAEITKQPHITKIILRKKGDNIVIDPFLLKGLYKGKIRYNLFLIM